MRQPTAQLRVERGQDIRVVGCTIRGLASPGSTPSSRQTRRQDHSRCELAAGRSGFVEPASKNKRTAVFSARQRAWPGDGAITARVFAAIRGRAIIPRTGRTKRTPARPPRRPTAPSPTHSSWPAHETPPQSAQAFFERPSFRHGVMSSCAVVIRPALPSNQSRPAA